MNNTPAHAIWALDIIEGGAFYVEGVSRIVAADEGDNGWFCIDCDDAAMLYEQMALLGFAAPTTA